MTYMMDIYVYLCNISTLYTYHVCAMPIVAKVSFLQTMLAHKPPLSSIYMCIYNTDNVKDDYQHLMGAYSLPGLLRKNLRSQVVIDKQWKAQ